ncbi:poly-gamma-glutamate synthesis protein (capsule biosynthesis protein) [Dethiosulfatibacter aminovorans DSM 17477]|uniref:Poly-gamma-glutamate synthesis protein (Capsule biosynthesis protein) n=1 Tax=Dethiosulfatibacter aminovorans DSM 17477 TaxID=1121476 RepID=A0A1M6H675_9FIRM|nr:CapA family protein [Dethiosulfatibacter aminovorans]SHJ17711.1 poly-gamma-glutamate synthesis protein (capsule biosynthesis protein) [Dethiosulfatibacter aminovorans DSM 17477]
MRRKRRRLNPKAIIIVIVLAAAYILFTNIGGVFGSDELNLNDLNKEEMIVAEADVPKTQKITLAAAGDIIFHMSQIDSGYDEQTDSYDFDSFFEYVKPVIEAADIAVANFEGTTGGTSESYKAYPRFNIPDETLDAVKYAGFDVLSTANNHTLDTYKDGLIRTLDEIEERGMLAVGTYREKPESRVLYVEEKGIKLAFLSYTFSCNGMESTMTPEDLDAMVNIVNENYVLSDETEAAKILEDIEEAKEEGADVITAIMHWGNEYQKDPSIAQRELADLMFTNGVDLILGSHPHVIQDSKTLEYEGEKKFVVYSMGNFISNQRQETLDVYYPNLENYYTEDGVIINIEIEKDFETGITTLGEIEFVPTWVYRVEAPPLYDYDVIPVEEYLKNNSLNLDDYTLSRMERSFRDTMSKMNINQ